MSFSSALRALVALVWVVLLALPVQAQNANTESMPVLYTFDGYLSGVASAAFSPDGKQVVTSGDGNTAKVWDTASGKLLNTRIGHWNSINFTVFSPDGKRIVTASDDKTAKVWDAASGELLNTLNGHTDIVLSAMFSPDGTRIVTASWDNTAKVWDASSGKLLNTLRGHTDIVLSATFSLDGLKIVTASRDDTSKVWDASSGRLLNTLPGYSFSTVFSPDGKSILIASDDNTAKMWDAASGKLLLTLSAHEDTVRSARFSTDGQRIVTASDDNTAKVWDAASGKLLTTVIGHQNAINSARFSTDGQRIVTASDDNTAKVWDTLSGRLLATLTGHTRSVESAIFSPDGIRVVTVSWDGSAKVWNSSSLFSRKLILTTQLPGTQVFENGTILGILPLELNTLSAGKHAFTFVLPGYLSQTLELNLNPGETLTRDITLLPALGALTLSSSPSGAQVSLAGKLLGVTPLKLENQPVGTRDYTFTLSKYRPLTRTLEITTGKVLEQSVTLERLPTLLQVQLEPIVSNAVLKVDGQNKGFVRQGKITLELDPTKTSAEVQIIASGFVPFSRVVTLEPSETNTLNAPLEARESVKLSPVPSTPPVLPVAPKPSPILPIPPTAPSSLSMLALPPRSDVYALVMGVSQYSLDVPRLEYAASDALRFSNLLTDPQGGNLVPRNVITLLNRDARRVKIEASLDAFGTLRSSDTLIVYFSGHGTTSKDGKPLLAPYDADPESVEVLERSTLALEDLQRQASATGAGRVVFILDACYSGSPGSRSIHAEGSKPFGVQLKVQIPSERLSVFSASSVQQASYESSTLKAGYFTGYLLEGLAGNADQNGDGKITLEELLTYTGAEVSRAVLRDRSATQTPSLLGAGDFALVVRPQNPNLEQQRQKLGLLKRGGKISGAQLDALLTLLEANRLPGDVADYLAGRLEEAKFLRRLSSGAVDNVPVQ